MSKDKIHIIAGPTASGKSARAIALAQDKNGVILNADATQCYADLSIISARPDAQELAQAEHRLYGIWSGDKVASVGDWLDALTPEVEQCWQAGQLPIICGGTGFYLKALMEGLSPIPDTDADIRAELQLLSAEELFELLQESDPEICKTIDRHNRQRLIRAVEVYESTGTPLSQWQAEPKQPPFTQAEFTLEIIDLPREVLYARCDARFDTMLARGAVREVQALLAKNYAAHCPVMKAVGVPEIAAYLRGELSIEEAGTLAKQNTRHYAKRQLTWLRNQMSEVGCQISGKIPSDI